MHYFLKILFFILCQCCLVNIGLAQPTELSIAEFQKQKHRDGTYVVEGYVVPHHPIKCDVSPRPYEACLIQAKHRLLLAPNQSPVDLNKVINNPDYLTLQLEQVHCGVGSHCRNPTADYDVGHYRVTIWVRLRHRLASQSGEHFHVTEEDWYVQTVEKIDPSAP